MEKAQKETYRKIDTSIYTTTGTKTYQEKDTSIHTKTGTKTYQKETNTKSTTSTATNGDDNNQHRAECGIGCFKPAALSVCATVPMFVGVYSITGLLSSSLSTYITSQVTAFERHFGFSSADTGLIIASNDIGILSVVLFVSYIATQVHIPRSLGWFSVVFGIAGIMSALPYFLYGAPSPESSNDVGSGNVTNTTSASLSASFTGQICDGVNDSSQCGVIKADASETTDNQYQGTAARQNAGIALAILIVCMVIQGITKAPRFAFNVSYIDNNADKVKTGFYIGIMVTVAFLGPVLAFVLGGIFSQIYVTLEETDLSYQHPKWIGAWWLGFIVFGASSIVCGIPVFCFPRRIKHTGEQEEKPASQQTDKVSAVRKMTTFVKGFVFAVMRLLLNPVYIFSVAASCALFFAVSGSQSFTPKYIENQFSFPAWKANMAMAGVMLGTGCLGTFGGGYLSKRFKMGPVASLKFTVVMHFLSCAGSAVMFLFKCNQPYIYNSPGPRATEETTIAGCMDTCACDDDDYFPVCGDDGRTFFSPCHAGCLQTVQGSYVNCTCITGGTAVAGMCDYSCYMSYLFLVFSCVATLFGTFAIIPKLIICIRSVEHRDQALAIGLSSFLTSIMGWMLGPICFGKLIDSICIQWERSCTENRACHLYDNDDFRWKLIGGQAVCKILALLFDFISLMSAKLTKKFENQEESEKNGHVTEMTVKAE